MYRTQKCLPCKRFICYGKCLLIFDYKQIIISVMDLLYILEKDDLFRHKHFLDLCILSIKN